LNDVRCEIWDAKGTLRNGCESHSTDPISHINNTMSELRDGDANEFGGEIETRNALKR
jgi:hypothetical protein